MFIRFESAYAGRMFLTQTTQLAMGALLFLARRPAGYLGNPREIAEAIEVAPAYTAKVLRTLARGGLVRSRRGATGGFELARSPNDLTLLQIAEVCQGGIVGRYCERAGQRVVNACGYHQAMEELQNATVQVLNKWTLARLLAAKPDAENKVCRMRHKFREDAG